MSSYCAQGWNSETVPEVRRAALARGPCAEKAPPQEFGSGQVARLFTVGGAGPVTSHKSRHSTDRRDQGSDRLHFP